MSGNARFAGLDTSRVPSGTVWGDCPWNELMEGIVPGYYFWDDFTSFFKTLATTEGNWAAEHGYAQFSSTGGTGINPDTTTQGGVWTFGSDDDNEGASIRTLSTPFRIDRSTRELWFEARIAVSTIADTKTDLFVGMMEDAVLTNIVPITAAGAIADQNLVGFFRPETARTVAGTGGAIMNTVYKANGVTAVNVQTDAVALVAATFTKIAFKFKRGTDKDFPGTNMLSFYQDGVRLSGSKNIPVAQGTDFPNDVTMGLVIAGLNAAGTSPGTASIDWWRAAQLTF
jgi:hypothetical protein